jgi:hypothetical protein
VLVAACESVTWPGDADAVREWLGRLQGEWRAAIEQITDDELRSVQRTRWPFKDRPFGDVVAWVNVELTKRRRDRLRTIPLHRQRRLKWQRSHHDKAGTGLTRILFDARAA